MPEEVVIDDRGGHWSDHLMMVLLVVKDRSPEGFPSRGVQAERPLLALSLCGGEAAMPSHNHRTLASANRGTPNFLGAIGGPMSEKAGCRIYVIAVVGQEPSVAAVCCQCADPERQQDNRIQNFPVLGHTISDHATHALRMHHRDQIPLGLMLAPGVD